MTTTTQTPASTFSLRKLLGRKDMAMAVGLVIIVSLLIVPLPAPIVDVLIVINLSISIGILLLTMYIKQPMEFSVFPTVLLLVTLFRLGINIRTSYLILLEGNAGAVVAGFGNMIIGGNYVVGVVIFLILMIIQFVVINSGAGRVAEVSARFTLDAMPGKQMSIDADLNAGLIDEVQARARRKSIESEADFYGAMDGASKFVRGDAIAAIIIMLVNILAGFVIGMLQKGMDAMTALQNYALVTIGAGLAVQIPALLISAASGLIVTRSTSEDSLGTDLFKQISNFSVLTVGAVIMGVLIIIPGLPKLPFVAVSAVLGGAAFYVGRLKRKEAESLPSVTEITKSSEAETPEDMMELIVIDAMELEIGYSLIPLIDDEMPDNLLKRITGIRRQMMSELGLVLPVVRIRDNLRLQPQAYRIKIRGQEVAHGDLLLDRLLAIPGNETDEELKGIETMEPAFGLPALWVSEGERGRAELMGYTVVNPVSVLSTHLTEVVRSHGAELLNRQMVQEMLNQLKSKSPASVEGVVPEMISLSDVLSVLRNLLKERVPIRDLSGILEVIANNANITRDPAILAEAVRQSLANTISGMYRDDSNTLNVFTLSPQLESALRSSLGANENGVGFQIDASLAQTILTHTGEQMEKMAQNGNQPVLLCPRELRLAFHKLVDMSLPNLVCLAFSEVSPGTRVKAHGMVEID
ncbi:MAG: flagellar biosynthesis protein FlhA [Chloroflexi bacterium HGW-Chloroflexi-4]|jgi:flagellar biosynthesis protein FlhA|nr:MAG: flagellar biosynthesis protein FlhA [Chloroflexi bacterium HGW-Chloroflexi-4]